MIFTGGNSKNCNIAIWGHVFISLADIFILVVCVSVMRMDVSLSNSDVTISQ